MLPMVAAEKIATSFAMVMVVLEQPAAGHDHYWFQAGPFQLRYPCVN